MPNRPGHSARHALSGLPAFAFVLALSAALICCDRAAAQLREYPDPCLDFVYPAGGQQGQAVRVEFGGTSGLIDAQSILVEGPPGVTVSEFETFHYGGVRATLTIAADAVPGRRLVRVVGGANGLTNYRYFFVGKLPEFVETEPNDAPDVAEEVAAPLVVNGQLAPALDEDCFRFQGRAGQSIVAAVLAHGMDTKLRPGFNVGFLDASLELLDSEGAVLAAAEDTLGLDPLIHHVLPADGTYTVRVRALAFKGARGCVYRLTLGEVPYPVAAFPPGGRRGESLEVELFGPNVPPGTRQVVSLLDAVGSAEAAAIGQPLPWRHVTMPGLGEGVEVPLSLGDHPETIELEPNDAQAAAAELSLPQTVNGRFHRQGDEDWYSIRLAQGAGIVVGTLAQRQVRAPVDTLVEIFNEQGVQVAVNDDGRLYAPQCAHDFDSADSWLTFTAPVEGRYAIRVREQSGAVGPRAVYRLTVEPLRPDYILYQWPDAVPVWGAGTTSAFVVQVFHWGGLTGDIRLRIEGLPDGWTGSESVLSAAYYGIYGPPTGAMVLMTITAPADAKRGDLAPFRVVGTIDPQPPPAEGAAATQTEAIVRVARAMTLYGNSHNDRMFLRESELARAVVAPPLDCRLETPVKELTVRQGGTVEIPVRVVWAEGATGEVALSVDGPTVAAGTGWRPPLALSAGQTEVLLPLSPSLDWRPGVYPIVVSRAWAADIRAGRPGPCTPIILLRIEPKEE